MPQVRVPVSKSGAVQTVRASNCIKSTCSVNFTYLFTDVRWVASSNRAVKAVWASYSSLYGHYNSASEDVRLGSKERAQFNGLANKRV